MRARLPELVGQVYRCVGEPGRWPDFLSALARAVASDQAMMLHGERHSAASQELVTAGLDLTVIARWNGCKEHVDVWLQHVFEVPANRPYLSTDLVRPGDLHRSAFHSDILRPLDIEYSVGGVTENDARRAGFFAVYRSVRRGPYTGEDLGLLRALVPHVLRALQIQRRIARIEMQSDLSAVALDQLAQGVVVFERAGRAILVNRRAQEILADADGLHLAADGLHAATVQSTAELRRLIHEACASGAGQGLASGGGLALPRPSGKRPLSLLVAPLPAGEFQVVRRQAAAVVFICDLDREVEIPLNLLQRLHGLTPAEARLTILLLQGRTLAAAGEQLGVSLHTVRNQVRSVFGKTDTHSQAELVLLLSRELSTLRR